MVFPIWIIVRHKPQGVLDAIRENWEGGPSNSKYKIQYVLDLRAKRHNLGYLTQESLENGVVRFCVYFKKFNPVSKSDTYLTPRLNQMVLVDSH